MKHKKIHYYKNTKNCERLKWLLITIIIILTTIIELYLHNINIVLKLTLILTSISVNIFILYFTEKGKQILYFIHESKQELQKVTWPSKQDTFLTTFIILIISILISLALWGIDHIIFRLISFIIALRL